MKTILSLVLFLAAVPLAAPAQTTVSLATNSAVAAVDSHGHTLPGFTNSPASQPPPVTQPNLTTRTGGVEFTPEGAVVRAAREGRVWQAFNPLAPARYGDGRDNVSWDLRTRQPNGLVLLSFPFGGQGRRQR